MAAFWRLATLACLLAASADEAALQASGSLAAAAAAQSHSQASQAGGCELNVTAGVGCSTLTQCLRSLPDAACATKVLNLEGRFAGAGNAGLVVQQGTALVLRGQGQGAVLDGLGQAQFFSVPTGGTLILEDLRLEAGRAQQGGAVGVHGGQLTARNCTFAGNVAARVGAQPSAQGGAVFIAGSANFTGCAFVNNTAVGPGTAYGGAMAIAARVFESVRIQDTTFRQNTAGDSTVTTASGGAIHSSGELVLERCTFESNRVVAAPVGDLAAGGAVTIQVAGPQTLLQAANCTFRENSASSTSRNGGTGGAIYLNSGASAYLRGCQFRHNSAAAAAQGTGGMGGALAIDAGNSDLVLERCEFWDNVASGGGRASDGGVGGAVALRDTSANITGCLFARNSAGGTVRSHGGSGGALASFVSVPVSLNKTLRISSCSFTENVAVGGGVKGGQGGAIFAHGALSSISASTFQANRAPGPDNGLGTGDGGAVAARERTLDLAGCQFSGNVAGPPGRGGALFLDTVVATIRQATFGGNEATGNEDGGGVGGALCASSSRLKGELRLSLSSFQGNVARGGPSQGGLGGAVAGLFLPIELSQSRFDENLAEGSLQGDGGSGGAVAAMDLGGNRTWSLSVVTSNFTSNRASAGFVSGGRGGAVLALGRFSSVQSCCFVGNRAEGLGDSRHTGGLGGAVLFGPGSRRASGVPALSQLEDSLAMNNSVSGLDARGGAIVAQGPGLQLNVTGSAFVQNAAVGTSAPATSVGGALFMDSALGNLSACEFVENTAEGPGSVLFVSSSSLGIRQALFQDNVANCTEEHEVELVQQLVASGAKALGVGCQASLDGASAVSAEGLTGSAVRVPCGIRRSCWGCNVPASDVDAGGPSCIYHAVLRSCTTNSGDTWASDACDCPGALPAGSTLPRATAGMCSGNGVCRRLEGDDPGQCVCASNNGGKTCFNRLATPLAALVAAIVTTASASTVWVVLAVWQCCLARKGHPGARSIAFGPPVMGIAEMLAQSLFLAEIFGQWRGQLTPLASASCYTSFFSLLARLVLGATALVLLWRLLRSDTQCRRWLSSKASIASSLLALAMLSPSAPAVLWSRAVQPLNCPRPAGALGLVRRLGLAGCALSLCHVTAVVVFWSAEQMLTLRATVSLVLAAFHALGLLVARCFPEEKEEVQLGEDQGIEFT